MARSYGRIFTSIWNDKDFRPLSVGAKLAYAFLISQDDIEHSGIIPFRPTRWARELGEPVEDVIAWLKELDEQRYTVTDEDEGELLVRSLIRRDDIWKQPNVFKSAAASAKASQSPRIKATLYDEVRRLTLVGTGRETHAIRDELLSHLEPFANRSPNPPEGFPNGSADPNGSPREPSAKTSGGVSEGLANHSAGATGKGEGYGPAVEGAFPLIHSPSPATATEPVRGLWPTAVPDASAEGEDSQEDETPELADLIAKVRAIRDDWSTDSIERVLRSRQVRERPWPMTCAAMLAVAADPASEHPGRLAHDGPWWAAARPARHRRLPPVDTHRFELADDEGDTCAACGLPESNRHHARAS